MLFPAATSLPRGGDAGDEGAGRVHPARQRPEDGGGREAGELLHHGPEVVHVGRDHGGRGPARRRRRVPRPRRRVLLATTLGRAPWLHGGGRGPGPGPRDLLAAGMMRGELERAASGAGLQVARVERGGGTCCRRVVLLLQGVHRRGREARGLGFDFRSCQDGTQWHLGFATGV